MQAVATRKSALDTITAALVARQSRGDDGSKSIDDQIEAMRGWCAKQTPPVVVGSVYIEQDVSGRKPLDKRKGLRAAVEDVEHERAQMILTAYFDRFARSVATRAEVMTRVEAKGGVVYTMDMGQTSNATPVSKFTGVVLAAAAELIADQAGEKTAVTKQRNIDNGVPPFPRITPAYVRRPDGRLEQHPTNGPLIHEACLMRARGVSYVQIARWLNEQGLKISVAGVITTLGSKLLIGEIHFGNFRPNLRAIDEPVIDRATFRKMHKAKASRGRHAQSDHLLARQSVLVCESCGARMSVQTEKRKSGSYPYYRCGNRLCERPAVISAPVAEAAVRDFAIADSASYEGHASAVAETETARVAVEEAQERLNVAIRNLAALADEPTARETLDELQAERDAAVERHEQLLARSLPALTLSSAEAWDAATLERRRSLIRATVARAVVRPGRGSDRVTVVGR